MTTTYDWATDTTTITSVSNVDLLYAVGTSFTVVTTLLDTPEVGSTGIKLTTGSTHLWFSYGPLEGANVINIPDPVGFIALQWNAGTYTPFYSVNGDIWQPFVMPPGEDGNPLPYPTFGTPTQAGLFLDTGPTTLEETVVFGSPRVLPGLLLVQVDADQWAIPEESETLKAIGAVPPVQPDPVTPSEEAVVHALVGAPFGDLEFDVGKSVGWLARFVDDLFVTDINSGDQRYWVVNWTKSFNHTYYKFSGLNYFVDPVAYRKGQFTDALDYADLHPDELVYDDNDWVIFLDAHEGLSTDTRSKPDDYLIAQYKSFIYREIARVNAAGQDRIVFPYYVFLRHDHIQNVSHDYEFEDESFTVTQSVGVPYYLPNQGMTRMFKVSTLRNPAFDWSLLDTVVSMPGTQGPELPYLNAVVGTATTPDPGPLPREFTFVYKVRGPFTGDSSQTIAAQYDGDPQRAWMHRRVLASGSFNWNTTTTGLAAAAVQDTLAAGVAITGGDELIAVAISQAASMTAYTSSDGVAWTQRGTKAITVPVPYDSIGLPVRIGAYNAAGGNVFNGRIYSVEARAGLSAAGGSAMSVPGYVSFPNPNAGSYLGVTLTPPTNLDVMIRVKSNTTTGNTEYPIGNFLAGNLSWGVLTNVANGSSLYLILKGPTGTNWTSTAPASGFTAGGWNWWRFTHTASNGQVQIFCQPDSAQVPTSWGAALVTQTSPIVQALTNAGQIRIGHGGNPWAGEIRQAILPNHSFNFNAAVDLPPSMNPATVPTIVSSSGHSMTVVRAATPPTIVPTTAGLLWKFDINEYPGTGTSYADPRGRTWTLTSAAAVVPYKVPDVKVQIVSYAYAHWSLQDIPPGETHVPPLTAENDLGWRQRCYMSMNSPVTGLPYGNIQNPVGTWVNPSADVAGVRGPWCFDVYADKVTGAVIPAPPPPVDSAVANILVPMYDLVFRINVRDGVWYAADGVGNTQLIWNDDLQEFIAYGQPVPFPVSDIVPANVGHTQTAGNVALT